MKSLLKNLGLIIIIVAAILLVACAYTGNVNNNSVLAGLLVAMVAGFILYIVINKRITD